MNVLITGGASGLGKALTIAFAKNTSYQTVFFTYNKSKENALEIEQLYPNCKAVFCDFNSEDSIAKVLTLFDEMQISILVNNAFTGLTTNHFHKQAPETFTARFKSNVEPLIRITQKAILHFRKNKYGKIITILTSYVIGKPPMGLSGYVAEKSYILSLSNSWAIENNRFNITSNCVSPSFMRTDLTANTDERVVESMIEAHPLKKLLLPEEVADAVLFIAGSSSQMNGTNLILNAASDL